MTSEDEVLVAMSIADDDYIVDSAAGDARTGDAPAKSGAFARQQAMPRGEGGGGGACCGPGPGPPPSGPGPAGPGVLAGRTTGAGRRPRGRDPLSAAEVAAACTAVRERHPGLNFVEVELHEGSSAGASGSGRRRAHVLTYDRRTNTTTSHVVAVGAGAGTGAAAAVEESVSHGEGQVQPAIDGEEYEAVERLLKRHPPFVAAMRARGFEDVEGRVAVDLWCQGWFSEADSPKKRLGRPLIFLKGGRGGNPYSCPVEGLEVLIDVAKMEIVEFADLERRPLPRPDAYSDFDGVTETAEHAAAGLCRPLKPLAFQQAEGPSFSVDGYKVEWWRWKFSVGWTPREGLVLHDVSVGDVDRGLRRQVAQRISFVEMVVPYGDPREPHCRKNAFDAGEDGLGKNANSLRLNCDCLGHIWYFDAHQSTWNGGVETIEQAICMHEEDQGLLWKHQDWRTGGQTHSKRARRLEVSFICTIANYDYRFSISFKVSMHATAPGGAED